MQGGAGCLGAGRDRQSLNLEGWASDDYVRWWGMGGWVVQDEFERFYTPVEALQDRLRS